MVETILETEFRGNFFRSRLEARWAKFFHALGVPYQYEPERYMIPDNESYLPDFWLPDLCCFLEVKPPEIEHDYRIQQLSSIRTKARWTGLLTGEPWPQCYKLFVYVRGASFLKMVNDTDSTFVWAIFDQESYPYTLGAVMIQKNIDRYRAYLGPSISPGHRYTWPRDEKDKGPLIDAYTAARIARFDQDDLEVKPTNQVQNSPTCPKCFGAMIQRTNRKDNTPFWGCSRYPNCTGTRDITRLNLKIT